MLQTISLDTTFFSKSPYCISGSLSGRLKSWIRLHIRLFITPGAPPETSFQNAWIQSKPSTSGSRSNQEFRFRVTVLIYTNNVWIGSFYLEPQDPDPDPNSASPSKRSITPNSCFVKCFCRDTRSSRYGEMSCQRSNALLALYFT
jgi:hypothetical protein